MKAPPLWLVRTVTRLTGGLAKLRRRIMPPRFAALELGTMSWVAHSVSAFCELGLPQALAGGARTAAELSTQGYGDETMLFRLLRALCAYDVVRYAGRGRFALGHLGKGLTGADSVAPMLLYANARWHVQGYTHLAQAVRTGRPGFDIAHGAPLFEYFSANPPAGAIFDAAMQALTPFFAAPFASAYDFSQTPHVLDVGGGTGLLLAAVLDRFANVRGTVFELPAVARRARHVIADRGYGGRLDVVEGNIFTDAPPAADAYIFSHILHDWDDTACARMLQNVRRAMPAHARVLVYEIVAPEPNNLWSQDRITDLEMMAMLPGRERTRDEFAALFAHAVLRLTRVVGAAAAESILEAVPV
jgi:hypothetical protein